MSRKWGKMVMASRGHAKNAQGDCFGTRVYEVDPANAAKYVYGSDKTPNRGDYVWETYEQVNQRAKDIGSGLVALGAKLNTNIGIFSANRAEWMISALAMWSQNLRVVPLYASLGENAIEFIVNQGDVAMAFVSKKELPNLLKALPKCKSLTHIIQFDVNPLYRNVEDVVSPADVEKCKALGVELIGLSQVQAEGSSQPRPAFPPSPEDIAYIMYTSGTTGNPKGVLLKHSNIVAMIASLPFVFTPNHTDRYLSYLPLAHVMETIAEGMLMSVGASIGFFQDNVRKLTLDLQAVRPTIFAGVPRVFNRMHQVAMGRINDRNCIVRHVIHKAINTQQDRLRAKQPLDESADKKVFAVMRESMGLSAVRLTITGAAPMPPYLQEFLRMVTNAPVIEGYGMTEASAATGLALPTDGNLGHVGPIVPCMECRLESIPDMGYLVTDKHPRGEVCVRGGGVFAGYYKDEENTKACMIDGWLHTGDVGRFNPNGTLSIIDRKKNMFKLSQGEYIAVEKVEQVYQQSPVVGQMWVYGNSFKSFLLAVVVPTAEPTAAWLFEKGWWPKADRASTLMATNENFAADFHSAMENPAYQAEIKTWVFDQLKEQEKALQPFSRVKDIIIESRIDKLGMGFTEANDCLTPTFKMRRPQLLQRYLAQLKALYAANGEPGDEKWPGEA